MFVANITITIVRISMESMFVGSTMDCALSSLLFIFLQCYKARMSTYNDKFACDKNILPIIGHRFTSSREPCVTFNSEVFNLPLT